MKQIYKYDPATGEDETGLVTIEEIEGNPSVIAIFIAGEILNGHAVVRLGADGRVYKADHTDVTGAGRVVGFTTHSATENAHVKVRFGGMLSETGWGLTPNARYFVGSNGSITATPPATGFLQLAGVAKDESTIVINISYPIIL